MWQEQWHIRNNHINPFFRHLQANIKEHNWSNCTACSSPPWEFWTRFFARSDEVGCANRFCLWRTSARLIPRDESSGAQSCWGPKFDLALLTLKDDQAMNSSVLILCDHILMYLSILHHMFLFYYLAQVRFGFYGLWHFPLNLPQKAVGRFCCQGFKATLSKANLQVQPLMLSHQVAEMGEDVVALGFPLGQNSLKISKGREPGEIIGLFGMALMFSWCWAVLLCVSIFWTKRNRFHAFQWFFFVRQRGGQWDCEQQPLHSAPSLEH